MLINVKTNNIEFKLNINSKINIVVGDSATNKSEFCDVVNALSKKNDMFITSNCDNLYRFTGVLSDFELTNSILVVDENDEICKQPYFKEFISKSNNIFIIVYRCTNIFDDNLLKGLNFGVKDVFKFTRSENVVYNEVYFNNCFDFILSDKTVTEASKTGNEFFSLVNKSKLKSMNGKDKFYKILKNCKSNRLDIIIDTIAFGNNYLSYYNSGSKIKVNMLDILSFEYILLISEIYGKFNGINEDHLYKENLEKEFYKILKEMSGGEYSKSELTDKIKENIDLILEKNDLTFLKDDNISLDRMEVL